MYDNSTPFTHLMGPFFSSDGDLATALDITTANLLISVNGSTLAAWDAGPGVLDADGYVRVTITTVDLGADAAFIRLVVNETSGAAMPFSTIFELKNQNAYHGIHGSSNLDVNVVQVDNSGPAARALADWFAELTTVNAITVSSYLTDFVSGTTYAQMPVVDARIDGSGTYTGRLVAFLDGMGSTVNAEDLSSQMVTYFNNFPFTELSHLTAFLGGLGSTANAEDLSSRMVDFFGGSALATLPMVNVDQIDGSSVAADYAQAFFAGLGSTPTAEALSTNMTAFFGGSTMTAQPQVNIAEVNGIDASALSQLVADPGNTPTLHEALMFLYHMAYHGTRQNASEMGLKNGTGEFLWASLTDAGSTFDRGVFSTTT